MATIQEKLSVLAGVTDEADSNLSVQNSERKNVAVADFKMVTFSLAGKDYAIDIMKIKEIAKAGHFTYVPNILPFVLGVYNLRGDIVPVIDLRLFFNIDVPEHDDDVLENMLIVSIGEQTFGVVVDAIDKVVGIQKSSIQPPHPLFGDISIKYIYGVVEAEKHLYILLDLDKIFGVKTPEEEKEFQQAVKKQMEERQKVAIELEEQKSAAESNQKVSSETKSQKEILAENQEQIEKSKTVDLNFIVDSLRNFKKFYATEVTQEWIKKRYADWLEERDEKNTQLQNEDDAEEFLASFYSKYTGTWWPESFAKEIENVLPDNSAKNIVVWNPGCGKGFESYSLACIMQKRYPNARIRIYGHDTDLLSVSNAPLMNLTDEASNDWYQPYTTRTVTGDYTFKKEIKDSIMFEYHDCVNNNSLPPIDIVFARDLLAFLPENSQKTVLADFEEKVKGNGIIIVGENEKLSIPGWTERTVGNVKFYKKQ